MDEQKKYLIYQASSVVSCAGPVLLFIGYVIFVLIMGLAAAGEQGYMKNPPKVERSISEPEDEAGDKDDYSETKKIGFWISLCSIIAFVFIIGISPISLLTALAFVALYRFEINKFLKFSMGAYALIILYYRKNIINLF